MSSNIIIAILFGFVLFIYLVRKWLRTYHRYDEPVVALKIADNHNWSFANLDLDENVCSFCDDIFSHEDAYYCENCAICCHKECLKLAKIQKCKQITVHSTDSSMIHHWIKNSLPVEIDRNQICSFCNDERVQLPNVICCWCGKRGHESCTRNVYQKCDFGRLHKHIVPPYVVKNVKQKKSVIHFELAIPENIKSECRKNWSPLIVIVNRRSGESWQGTQVVRYFYQHLNPLQVINLSPQLLHVVLTWCKEFDKEGVQSTILVAGGDGSVAWILNTIYDAHLKCVPTVGVIPLGTGNDLSRILGFGGSVDADLPFSHLIDQLDECLPVPLDRWNINIKSKTRLKLHKERNLYFYNYFGIGVDAKVAHTFDRFRKLSMYIIRGRFFNKILYAISGTKQAVGSDCNGLPHILEVYMDGVRIELANVESVVFLNIPSWAGGVDLWALGNMTNQSVDDGQLEAVAINSTFHMAALRADLSQPHIIGQASQILIKLNDTMAVQADGEPWMQEPATITLSFSNQVTVLKKQTL